VEVATATERSRTVLRVLRVQGARTVGEVKCSVEQQTGIPRSAFRLSFRNVAPTESEAVPGGWLAEEPLRLELRVRGGGLVASCCGPRAAQVAPAAARDEETRVEEARVEEARVEETRVEEELLALLRESGIEHLAPTLAAQGLASKSGVHAALESMRPEDVAAKLKLSADNEAKFLKLCKQRIMGDEVQTPVAEQPLRPATAAPAVASTETSAASPATTAPASVVVVQEAEPRVSGGHVVRAEGPAASKRTSRGTAAAVAADTMASLAEVPREEGAAGGGAATVAGEEPAVGSFPPFAGTSSSVAEITRLERELAAANSEVSRLKAILPEAAPRGTYDEVQKSGPDQSAQDVASTSADPPRLPPAARACSEWLDRLSRRPLSAVVSWQLLAWNSEKLHSEFTKLLQEASDGVSEQRLKEFIEKNDDLGGSDWTDKDHKELFEYLKGDKTNKISKQNFADKIVVPLQKDQMRQALQAETLGQMLVDNIPVSMGWDTDGKLKDPVQEIIEYDVASLKKIFADISETLAKKVHSDLVKLKELRNADKASDANPVPTDAKFTFNFENTQKMESGTFASYIGLPGKDIFKSMEEEHKSEESWKTGNYNLETNPLQEWNFVVNPKEDLEYPGEDRELSEGKPKANLRRRQNTEALWQKLHRELPAKEALQPFASKLARINHKVLSKEVQERLEKHSDFDFKERWPQELREALLKALLESEALQYPEKMDTKVKEALVKEAGECANEASAEETQKDLRLWDRLKTHLGKLRDNVEQHPEGVQGAVQKRLNLEVRSFCCLRDMTVRSPLPWNGAGARARRVPGCVGRFEGGSDLHPTLHRPYVREIQQSLTNFARPSAVPNNYPGRLTSRLPIPRRLACRTFSVCVSQKSLTLLSIADAHLWNSQIEKENYACERRRR